MGRNTGGLSDIKTAQKAKVSARPKVKGSEYLDLFIMEKNKARLEQEKSSIDRKSKQVEEDLKKLQEEMEAVEKALSGGDQKIEREDAIEKRLPKKPLKTMRIDY